MITDFTSKVLLFTAGRSCAGPLKVVLHQYESGLDFLDNEMIRCPRPRPAQSPGCHTSYHYGVSGCIVHQYVALANTAWGFYITPDPCPEPECPIIQTCDGIGADQYNTLPDGTAVTPPPLTGADGTPNCQVIHVAVTAGINQYGENIYCLDAPIFDAAAYDCLVKSLCAIFDAAGLVPDASTNLLVHVGELVGLDTVQLALDIIDCQNAPGPVLPPCNCDPIGLNLAVTDTATVNMSIASGDTFSASVIVDPTVLDNQLTAGANGLSVPNFRNLVISLIDEADTTIDPDDADVFVYDGVGADSQQVLNPTSTRNHIYVKNISVDNLTLTFAAANGVDNLAGASLVIEPQDPGNYPFGNDGGETVHLVYSSALQTWLVI